MEYLLFGIPAALAIFGAVAMLVSKNAVHSALFLLLNFGAMAVLYLLLQAPFLFATQLIVYAGAIIVLFLFVVMLLGAERDEHAVEPTTWQNRGAFIGGLALLVELVLIAVKNPTSTQVAVNSATDFASPRKSQRRCSRRICCRSKSPRLCC